MRELSLQENSPLKNIGFNKTEYFQYNQNDKFRPQRFGRSNLEDMNSTKLTVFSNDQVEARYLITPAFMERLKNKRYNECL
ncbi:MAG: DUF3137 domain-containing protein [Candidatus Gastranaerophilaceae bacterium]